MKASKGPSFQVTLVFVKLTITTNQYINETQIYKAMLIKTKQNTFQDCGEDKSDMNQAWASCTAVTLWMLNVDTAHNSPFPQLSFHIRTHSLSF